MVGGHLVKMVKQITSEKFVATTYEIWSTCEQIKQIIGNTSVVTILIRSVCGQIRRITRYFLIVTLVQLEFYKSIDYFGG